MFGRRFSFVTKKVTPRRAATVLTLTLAALSFAIWADDPEFRIQTDDELARYVVRFENPSRSSEGSGVLVAGRYRRVGRKLINERHIATLASIANQLDRNTRVLGGPWGEEGVRLGDILAGSDFALFDDKGENIALLQIQEVPADRTDPSMADNSRESVAFRHGMVPRSSIDRGGSLDASGYRVIAWEAGTVATRSLLPASGMMMLAPPRAQGSSAYFLTQEADLNQYAGAPVFGERLDGGYVRPIPQVQGPPIRGPVLLGIVEGRIGDDHGGRYGAIVAGEVVQGILLDFSAAQTKAGR